MKYPVNRLFAWAGAASIALAVALLWRRELAPPSASRLALETAGAVGSGHRRVVQSGRP